MSIPFQNEPVGLNITLKPDPTLEFQACYKNYSLLLLETLFKETAF